MTDKNNGWNKSAEGELATVERQSNTVKHSHVREGDASALNLAGIELPDPLIATDPAREALLSNIIAQTVIPTLLSLNKSLVLPFDELVHPNETHIKKLSALILGPDNADALDYINFLRNRGISLDILHLELLEPTARYLGELWNNDEVDFIAVTVGVSRLQRIVHHFADLDKAGPYDDKRRALIMVAPGEDHNFGNQIVQRFMRAAGWSVFTLIGTESDKVINLVSNEWLAVVGFSISVHTHLDALAATIKLIRANSFNPHIGIMVGGPMVVERPELVKQIGADGTAVNAASAVILAKKLLAVGLQAENTEMK